jgi:hypothetical protein
MCSSLDALEGDIIEQVCLRLGKQMAVSLNTEIYKDAGLYGMDVFEIVTYLHNQYGTIFDGLDLNDYVPAEVPLLRILKVIGLYSGRNYKSLTIRHLVEVVKRGAWFTPADGS